MKKQLAFGLGMFIAFAISFCLSKMELQIRVVHSIDPALLKKPTLTFTNNMHKVRVYVTPAKK